MFRLLATGFAFVALLYSQASSPEAALQRAMELQQSGDLAGAVQGYRDFLAVHPSEVAVRSNLGVLLSRLGRFDEAITEYRKALGLAPGNPDITLNLGLAYYKSGRIPQAAEEFSEARQIAPENQQITLLLADCRLQMGQNEDVITLVQPLEGQNPNDLAIAYLLGTALIRANRIAEGQQRVDRILRNGDSAEGRFLLGSQMFAAGDFPAAVKQLASARELNPNLPGVASLYGQALLNTGDPDAAATAFQRELVSNPNDFAANLYLAEIFIARKKWTEAEPLLARALRVRPDSVAAKLDLAKLTARDDKLGSEAKAEDPNRARGLRTGDLAPEFSVTSLGTAERVTLAQLRSAGPSLLVFGSYTCPNFRAAAEHLNALYARYKDQIRFYLIYIREAHSTEHWQSTRNERDGIVLPPPKNMSEQQEHANLCVRKLHLPFPTLMDDMNGTAEKAYSAWPSKVYVVDRGGRILFSSGLSELDFNPDQLEAAVRTATTPIKATLLPARAQ
jgi:Flp pilus assembly protein TadD/thiol-disulfide isomerase/thioredoxin